MTSDCRPRVLFVIGSMGGGGAERQVLEILKRLDRSRFEPMLYLTVKQGEFLSDVPRDVPIFSYWDGSPETWPKRILRWMKLTRLLRFRHLARILREQQIDVIYDRTYLATLDAAGGCLFRPTPRISCCVADPGPELELHARGFIRISRWIARRAYRSASLVLANSEGLRLRVIEYFQLNPERVQVLHNLLSRAPDYVPACSGDPVTVDRPSIESKQSLLNAIFSSDENRFRIVTAGRLHPQKGQRYLIEAVDILVHQRGRSVSLVIFGQGEAENELQQYIRTHDLEKSVTLAGFVSEPRQWYSKTSLFVLPSFFEGMPNALIEAVACGVPALATTCPSGPKEILDHGRCGGLVPPGDSMALADAIADAMDHPDEWKARAERGRQRVIEMFDAEKGIRRLEALLQEIAGSTVSRKNLN